eukprot:jgi/Botrbrau1/3568/Bobra.0078s0025.1
MWLSLAKVLRPFAVICELRRITSSALSSRTGSRSTAIYLSQKTQQANCSEAKLLYGSTSEETILVSRPCSQLHDCDRQFKHQSSRSTILAASEDPEKLGSKTISKPPNANRDCHC